MKPTATVPEALKPTRRQLRYLRVLADRTATSFAYPQTIDAASVEITPQGAAAHQPR